MVSETSKEIDVRLSSYSEKEGWLTITITDPQRASVETLCEIELIAYNNKNGLTVHILSFYCVKGTALSTSHELGHFVLKITLWGRYYNYPYSIAGKERHKEAKTSPWHISKECQRQTVRPDIWLYNPCSQVLHHPGKVVLQDTLVGSQWIKRINLHTDGYVYIDIDHFIFLIFKLILHYWLFTSIKIKIARTDRGNWLIVTCCLPCKT